MPNPNWVHNSTHYSIVIKDSWSGLIYTWNLATKPLHMNFLPPCLTAWRIQSLALSTLPQLQCLRGLIKGLFFFSSCCISKPLDIWLGIIILSKRQISQIWPSPFVLLKLLNHTTGSNLCKRRGWLNQPRWKDNVFHICWAGLKNVNKWSQCCKAN
jgi:hypothetical protein